MKDHINEYMGKLEKGMCDYMQNPVNERSAVAVREMADCWRKLRKVKNHMCKDYKQTFTHDDAAKWNKSMVNDDGTVGGHWDIIQTSAVAESIGFVFEHVDDWCFNVAMNMMYSDYCKIAEKYGVNTPEFYADLTKAFLFDKDGGKPMHKLAAYYHCVVNKE